MNGLSVAALLLGRLRPPREPGPPGPALRRLGWMLLAQLALFAGGTAAVWVRGG